MSYKIFNFKKFKNISQLMACFVMCYKNGIPEFKINYKTLCNVLIIIHMQKKYLQFKKAKIIGILNEV